jgi:hypothetical protein
MTAREICKTLHDGRCDHCDEPGMKLYVLKNEHHNNCLICIFCWTDLGLEIPKEDDGE